MEDFFNSAEWQRLNGSSGELKKTTVRISNATLIASTAPAGTALIDILPTPGAGKMIVFEKAVLNFNKPVEYVDLANPAFLYLLYKSSGDVASQIARINASNKTTMVAVLGNAGVNSDSVSWANFSEPNNAGEKSFYEDSALSLVLDNGGVEVTGGDESNYLDVTVWYYELTF